MKKPHDNRMTVTNLVADLLVSRKDMYHFHLDEGCKSSGTVTYGSKSLTKWRLSRPHKDADMVLNIELVNMPSSARNGIAVTSRSNVIAELQSLWGDLVHAVVQEPARPKTASQGHLLLMWERIPEETQLYLIPIDAKHELTVSMIRKASNDHLGGACEDDNDDAVLEVCTWVDSGAAAEFRAETPFKCNAVEVIRAGVIL